MHINIEREQTFQKDILKPLIVSLGGGFPSDFMLFLIVFNIFQNVNSKHVFLLIFDQQAAI